MPKKKDDCLFCKILKKEIPANIVYENKDVVAFLDIKPVSPGHTLVVSKKHYKDLLDLPDEDACELIKAVKFLSEKVMRAVSAQGFNIHINNFSAAGQVVGHVHIHIIPRFEQDSLELWKGKDIPQGEIQTTAEKIRNLLK